ncbi:MAG TPA: recombinase family protein [Candidatus Tetragenococcus pullicola]|nr:recombinase family protein [Candidatus Tetragenococcus pullicola]
MEIYTEEKKRAVIYVRVSTTEQAVEGYSLDAQEKVGREHADKMGYEVVNVYRDEGISGKSIKGRLAFQRMMKDLTENKFEMVIIWKLTRLGRNMVDIAQTVEQMGRYNVALSSISEQFDISSSSGRFMCQILGSISEFERNQISENVAMAMQSLVREHKRYAGGRRLGYVSGMDEHGNKQLIVEPEEAKIVRLIYSKYLEGNGYRAIANFLNRQGYRTVKGNAFSTIAVKDILYNKVYGGYLEYARYLNWETKRRKGKNPNPILVEGCHEPIVDKETYEMVQERLSLEKRQPQPNHRGENVLTGLLRCPECGAPMAASNVTNTLKGGIKKKIRYYSCSQFRNKGASVCHANSIRADDAEKFVRERLLEMVQVPGILKSLVKSLNAEIANQIKPLEQELAVIITEKEDTVRKLDKLKAAVIDMPDMLESLDDRIRELEEKRINCQVRENEILSFLERKEKKVSHKNVQQIGEGLEFLLKSKNKNEVKKIYCTFIEKITFDKDSKDDIRITMKFDQPVIDQLNQIYAKETPEATGASFFSLETPFVLTV